MNLPRPVPASEPSPRYLRLLLWLLLPAALFNSYDGELRAVLLKQLAISFHVHSTTSLGLANIPIGAGQYVAFFAVLYADRVGRRPILLWSILGYTVFTTLSAAAWNLWSFAAFQCGAQVFIGAEFGVAATLLAEEVPAEHRGRYFSYFLLLSPLGAVLAGGLLDAGLLHNPIGWRAFFLIALIPLVVVTVARRRLRESHAWLASAGARLSVPRRSARQLAVDSSTVWRGPQRSRVLAVGVISFIQLLVTAAATGWFVWYAEHERHFSTGTAGTFFALAALVAVGGYFACGPVMDWIGRRWTATLYIVAAVACAVFTFQVANRWVMLPFLVGTAFFGLGMAPVLSAFAAELFPTAVRAQASGWIRNAWGTTGSVIGPTIVGVLGAATGPLHDIGDAMTVTALLLLVAVPIIWATIPETRGVSLDEPNVK